MKKTFVKAAVSASLVGALAFTGASSAQASVGVPATSTVSIQASTSTPIAATSSLSAASTLALGGASSSSGNLVTLPPADKSGQASIQALPALAIRLAVRAALEAIKRVSYATYTRVIGAVKVGKTHFVNFFNNTLKPWLKARGIAILDGVSGAVVFEVIRWIIGF